MSRAARCRCCSVVLAGMLAVVAATTPPAQASTLATLELSTNRASAGDEVSFRGWYYNDVHPVVIRWQRLDGPVLATVTPDTFGMVHNHFRTIAGSLRIPADARPGTHLLLATQDFAPPAKITFGVPARAQIQVGDHPEGLGRRDRSAGAARPASITVAEGPGRDTLLMAALAGTVLSALVVGLALLPRRRAASS